VRAGAIWAPATLAWGVGKNNKNNHFSKIRNWLGSLNDASRITWIH